MARRKHEEEQAPAASWMNTFADLMNLLLCFFVLLFSMSTVDADKYEQLVTSMTESINIFDGGGAAVNDGAFIASGTDQLVSISEYFNEFEKSGQKDATQNDDEPGKTSDSKTKEEDEYRKRQEAEKQQRTEELYGKVKEEARKKSIEDDIDINIDKQHQYVQISLNGAILFDSGEAEIKKSSLPLLSKVGDILKIYDSHYIKIEGHTDNVKISSAKYRNNMWLSTARATEVFEYLRHEKGLSPKTLEPTGKSSYEPVASNDTSKGRAQNRRVELKIYTDK